MRWPKYEELYVAAFDRMLETRRAKGKPCDWHTGRDVSRWWMEDDNVNGQLSMDDLMGDNNV
jgi:phosphoadenosine phosphosulfate reductase